MRPIMRRIFFLVLLLAPWAAGADEAEALYASFHRAALAADVKAMERLITPAMRERMLVDRNTHQQARKLAAILPRSYTVSGRATGATRVVLNLDGMGGALLSPDGKPGRMRGKARLLREGAGWKLDYVEWLSAVEPLPFAPPTLVRPDLGAKPMAVQPAPGQPRAVGAPRRAVGAPAAAQPAPAR